MKYLWTKYGKYLAALALIITTSTANTTCRWLVHQPELPKEAKKLRKF